MIILTEIHIAHNCQGMAQKTKRIKPQEHDSVSDLETIRAKIKKRFLKKGLTVEVFFVYRDENI